MPPRFTGSGCSACWCRWVRIANSVSPTVSKVMRWSRSLAWDAGSDAILILDCESDAAEFEDELGWVDEAEEALMPDFDPKRVRTELRRLHRDTERKATRLCVFMYSP